MSEVSCRTIAPIIKALNDRGLPSSEMVRGLDISADDLLRPSHRISWAEFIVVLENAAEIVGGARGLDDLSAAYYDRAGWLLGAVAPNVTSSRRLYHMGARWYGPTLFTNTKAVCEDLPDGRIRQTVEIMPGYQHSDLFFHSMRGGLRSIPSLLGQPQARVDMEITEGRAVYLITPPPSLTIWGRIQRFFSWQRTVAEAEQELVLQRDELREGNEMARRSLELLSFQTKRLEHEQTQRERAEELMLQAQKLATVGRLAGGIAHDFNNLLTTVAGYADVALDRLPPEDPMRRDMEELRRVGERGASFVRQLLEVARPQAVEARIFSLNDALTELEPLLQRVLSSSIRVSVLPAPEDLKVVLDPGRFEQTILNLAVNARDAMPGGGSLEIEASLSRKPGANGPGVACIEVRDTGQGMDRVTLEKAFEPFFTTKDAGQGSGLGLASVHSIVSSAGGRTRIESEPGKGTRVLIELPLAAEGRLQRA